MLTSIRSVLPLQTLITLDSVAPTIVTGKLTSKSKADDIRNERVAGFSALQNIE